MAHVVVVVAVVVGGFAVRFVSCGTLTIIIAVVNNRRSCTVRCSCHRGGCCCCRPWDFCTLSDGVVRWYSLVFSLFICLHVYPLGLSIPSINAANPVLTGSKVQASTSTKGTQVRYATDHLLRGIQESSLTFYPLQLPSRNAGHGHRSRASRCP